MEQNITTSDLQRLAQRKYGAVPTRGWGPKMRDRFGYYTPDDWYETLLDQLVTPSTRWLEVGCGRRLFPSNAALAATLSARCARLVGVDQSDNIAANPYLHAYQRAYLEEFNTDEVFDLITLRMVAEHVREPERLAAALTKLLAPGGRMVIYTDLSLVAGIHCGMFQPHGGASCLEGCILGGGATRYFSRRIPHEYPECPVRES